MLRTTISLALLAATTVGTTWAADLPAPQRTKIGRIAFPWVESAEPAPVVLCEEAGAVAAFLIDDREPFAVQRAVADVREDLFQVTGRRFPITYAAPKKAFHRGLIIAGTRGRSRALKELTARGRLNLDMLDDRPESFALVTVTDPFPGCDGALVIAGSDPRGTIYGLYALSQSGLGVDPLRFWTEKPVTQRATLRLGAMAHVEDSPRFRYRGWFINDEDLLMGWHPAGPTRVAPEVMEVILTTSLRCRQNMIIPMTLFSLENPTDRAICDMVKQFGLLLTMHHAMPLGVWGRDWDIYWHKKTGQVPAYSWMNNQELFREIWEHGAEAYAPYVGIWQTGMRGKGDDPIWRYDRDFPKDPAERGRLIREAVEMQINILRKATERQGEDRETIPMTTTLWFEGLDLYNAGHLRYPEEIMLIVADWGRGNMDHLDTMGWDKPFPEGRAGIYYHLAFQDGFDSHLVQTVHPDRIREAFDMVFKHNLTAYCLVNVANVREYVMGIQAMSDLLWTGAFAPDAFYEDWCRHQFGAEAARRLPALYKRWFAIPYRYGDTEDKHFMVQGLVQYGQNLLDAARRGDVTDGRYGVAHRPDPKVRRQLPTYRYWVHLQNHRGFDETIAWFGEHGTEDAQQWADLYADLEALEAEIPADRRTFYRDNVLLQCFTAQRASQWIQQIVQGVRAYQAGDLAGAKTEIRAARQSLQDILDRQETAEHGKWAGYYEHHSTVPFEAALRAAEEFLDTVDHQLLHRPALARVNFRTPPDTEGLTGFRPGATWRSMPVANDGCAVSWPTAELSSTPALALVELRTLPRKPVAVTINGQSAGTIAHAVQGVFEIPDATRDAAIIRIGLAYPPSAGVTHIRGITLYGPITQPKAR